MRILDPTPHGNTRRYSALRFSRKVGPCARGTRQINEENAAMQSVNAMKSMDELNSNLQQTRPGSRLRALVCAGLHATLAACSDAAPSAPAPPPLPSAASPATSSSSFDA